MNDTPKTIVERRYACLKPAPWKAYPGVCVQAKAGHGKRCQFVPAEFVEVR